MNTSANLEQRLPSGMVTFLFTDIEGSTKMAQSLGDKCESLRARYHKRLISSSGIIIP